MCELCGTPEETRPHRDEIRGIADRLERHVGVLRSLADGRLMPHTDECKRAGDVALGLIRELVNQWM